LLAVSRPRSSRRRAVKNPRSRLGLPRRATLLNTGAAIPCSLDLVPSEHGDQGRYLRLGKLPVNEHANTMLVAKLEFDRLPAVLGSAKESGASVL
jgi:hypothetical protein